MCSGCASYSILGRQELERARYEQLVGLMQQKEEETLQQRLAISLPRYAPNDRARLFGQMGKQLKLNVQHRARPILRPILAAKSPSPAVTSPKVDQWTKRVEDMTKRIHADFRLYDDRIAEAELRILQKLPPVVQVDEFFPLSQEAEQLIRTAWGTGSQDEIMCSKFHLDVTVLATPPPSPPHCWLLSGMSRKANSAQRERRAACRALLAPLTPQDPFFLVTARLTLSRWMILFLLLSFSISVSDRMCGV